jgi:hypothetical protein
MLLFVHDEPLVTRHQPGESLVRGHPAARRLSPDRRCRERRAKPHPPIWNRHFVRLEGLMPDGCAATPKIRGIPKNMPCVRGRVVGGRGDFGQWIELLTSLYEQKTGMRLYPGTLNVELSSEYSLPADVIRLDAGEYGGRVSVSIVPCRIFNRQAFLLRTDQNEQGTGHHP